MAEVDAMTATYRASFRLRAKLLRRNANLILTIIVLVLIAGIAVFVGAGSLANREATTAVEERRSTEVARLREQRELITTYIARQERDIAELQNRLQKELAGQGSSRTPGDGPVAARLRMELQSTDLLLASAKRDLENTTERIDQLQKQLATAKPGLTADDQWFSVVSALSTRVGAVVLLLFLVQILVPLYRYNIRLASFFDARADALEMYALYADIQLDKTQAFGRLLAPDGVEFGNPPATPAKQAFELAKEVLAIRRDASP